MISNQLSILENFLFSRCTKTIFCIFAAANANVAQLVEHQLPKLRVAGSNPVIRSRDLISSRGARLKGRAFVFSNPLIVQGFRTLGRTYPLPRHRS